jgi:hypothetical protein
VRTAPPERIEQAHEEAFAKLTPQQRRLALQELSREVPAGERATGDDPRSLARMATRAEVRDPGSVERAFGRVGGGFGGGFGGGLGGIGVPLLASFATAFAGTLAAEALFSDLADGELFDGPQDDGDADGDRGDVDPGGEDYAAGDMGGDYGDGDYSGGDLGGGDFGGGDF